MTFRVFREWWANYRKCLREGHLWEILPGKVVDGVGLEHVTCTRCHRDEWRRASKAPDVRAFFERQMAALERARPLCPDHRDKAAKHHCLLCEIERLQRENEYLKNVTTIAARRLPDEKR